MCAASKCRGSSRRRVTLTPFDADVLAEEVGGRLCRCQRLDAYAAQACQTGHGLQGVGLAGSGGTRQHMGLSVAGDCAGRGHLLGVQRRAAVTEAPPATQRLVGGEARHLAGSTGEELRDGALQGRAVALWRSGSRRAGWCRTRRRLGWPSPPPDPIPSTRRPMLGSVGWGSCRGRSQRRSAAPRHGPRPPPDA